MAQGLYYNHLWILSLLLNSPTYLTSVSAQSSSTLSSTNSGFPRIIAPPSSPTPKSHKASLGLAIGIVLGLLGALVLGVLTWWVVRRRWRKRRRREAAAEEWLRGVGGGGAGDAQREIRDKSDTNGKYATSSGGSSSPKASTASPRSVAQPRVQTQGQLYTQELNRGANTFGIWTQIKDLFSRSSSMTAVQTSSPQGTWPPPLGALSGSQTQGTDPNHAYYPYPYLYDPNSSHSPYDPNINYNPYDPNYAASYPNYPYPSPAPDPNPNLYQAPHSYPYPYDPNAPPNRAPNRYIPGYTLSTITEKSTPQSFNANRSLRHGGASSVITGGAGGAGATYSPMSGMTVSEELGAGYWTASEGGHEAGAGAGFGEGVAVPVYGEKNEGKKEKKKTKDKKNKQDSHEGEKKGDRKDKRSSWFRS